jgi:hypothetical protein
MPSARINSYGGVMIRCWDGTEMEPEHFSEEELMQYINEGLTSQQLANRIGAVRDIHFEKVYNQLKKEADGTN